MSGLRQTLPSHSYDWHKRFYQLAASGSCSSSLVPCTFSCRSLRSSKCPWQIHITSSLARCAYTFPPLRRPTFAVYVRRRLDGSIWFHANLQGIFRRLLSKNQLLCLTRLLYPTHPPSRWPMQFVPFSSVTCAQFLTPYYVLQPRPPSGLCLSTRSLMLFQANIHRAA